MSLSIEEIIKRLIEVNPSSMVTAEHSDVGHYYRSKQSNRLFASVTTKAGILDSPHLKKWSAELAVKNFLEKVTIEMVKNKDTNEDIQKLATESVMVHQDIFEDAGDCGTKGHKVIETFLLDWMKTGKQPHDIKQYIKESDSRIFAISRSAEMFCNDFDVMPIASEMYVASERYRYAGTLDSLMMVMNIKKQGNKKCDKHFWLQSSHSKPNKKVCTHCGAQGEHEFSIVDWKTSNSIDKPEYAMQVSAYWNAIYEMTGLRPKQCYVVRLDKKVAKYEVRKLKHRPSAFAAFNHIGKVWEWLNDGTDKLIKANPKTIVSINNIKLNTIV